MNDQQCLAEDMADAIAGLTIEQIELKRDLRKLDPHAASVLAQRIETDRRLGGSLSLYGSISLGSLFVWADTPEGHKYWADLDMQLCGFRQQAVLERVTSERLDRLRKAHRRG